MSIKAVSYPEKDLLSKMDITSEELEAIILKAEEGPFYSLEEGWKLVNQWREGP